MLYVIGDIGFLTEEAAQKYSLSIYGKIVKPVFTKWKNPSDVYWTGDIINIEIKNVRSNPLERYISYVVCVEISHINISNNTVYGMLKSLDTSTHLESFWDDVGTPIVINTKHNYIGSFYRNSKLHHIS